MAKAEVAILVLGFSGQPSGSIIYTSNLYLITRGCREREAQHV